MISSNNNCEVYSDIAETEKLMLFLSLSQRLIAITCDHYMHLLYTYNYSQSCFT